MPISHNPSKSDTNSEIFACASVAVSTVSAALTTGASIDDVQFVHITNNGPNIVYLGPSGQELEPLYKGQWIEYAVSGVRVYGKTSSGSATVVVTELG